MTTPSTALVGLVLGASLLAAVFDTVSRRIPNVLPLAIIAGVAIERAHHGWGSLASGAGALALVLIIGTFAHSRGWFGGGDVKLAAAAAAAFGVPACFSFLAATGVCGGVVAVATLALTRRLGAREAVVAADALFRSHAVILAHKHATVPYAIAIALGAAAASLSLGTLHLP